MNDSPAGSGDRGDRPRGAVAVLGPPLPRNPVRWIFLAAKAAAATLLALILDRLVGNPDHVTSTFVAVLCISPVVVMGLRRSLDQVTGSLVGGLAGTAMALAGVPVLAGIPLAVGVAILASFALRRGDGYTVAAFTALFVQAVPWGGAWQTLGVRLLAVAIGAASAFFTNVLVSSAAYRDIFNRRLRYAEATVAALLLRAAERGPRAVEAGFPILAELERDLDVAAGEMRVRRSRSTQAWLRKLEERAAALRRLLHLVLDLDYRLDEEGLPADALQDWLRWLVAEGGEEPPVPAAIVPTTRRIRRLGENLRHDLESLKQSP